MVWQEVQANWRKSKHCDGGSCVEIQVRSGFIAVRDGDDPGGSPLVFSMAGWRGFTEQAKRHAFDPGSVRPGSD